MTTSPRPFDRADGLRRLGTETFDVVVVGGGITGAGVLLDAASRGLKAALVERDDFASGTSSKSSKLVHGGLRYLQQREYLLVYENLHERQRLLENAPHLVKPLPFLIPLFGKDGMVNKTVAKAYRTALWLYDLTGGIRIGKRHARVTPDEALRHMPTLRTDVLAAAFLYWDAQADDARLTLTVMRTAVEEYGAVAVNHAGVRALAHDAEGRVSGVTLVDGTEVRARAVVNATGVWSDELRAMDEGRRVQSIRPAKGIHLTVPQEKLPADIAAVVPVPKDRRSIFVVPWGDVVYLGTTDTDYQGPLEDPPCTPEDVAYVLGAINAWVTRKVEPDDVLSAWAGLRPLVRDEESERTADLSRRHAVLVSDHGLVTITGGKLTTYRKMAQDTVDEVARRLGTHVRRSPTAKLKLFGAAGVESLSSDDAAERLGLDADLLAHLVSRFGTDARVVAAMIAADDSLAKPLVPGLPYVRAEAVYAARYEMARTVEDVLSRRTRALLLARDATANAADDVARLIAPELGWTDAEVAREAAAFRELAHKERADAGLPPTELPEARPTA